MKDVFTNFLKMVAGLFNFLDGQSTVTAKIPAFGRAIAEGKIKLNEIEIAATDMGEKATGKTGEKNDIENGLIKMLVKISNGLYAYGDESNNPELIEKSGTSAGRMRKMKDADLATFAKARVQLVGANLTELADFGITAEDLTKTNLLIEQFESINAEITSKLKSRAGASKDVEAMVDALEGLVENRLDKYAEMLSEENSSFYNAYAATRNVYNYGKRYEKTNEPQQTGS